ncbi:hypothetical protein ACFS2C_00770 [Prauserella oleivorans]|uniref:Uncharacterized protein n=1 Tax=Prauserella oleivorans TaxID=1478153 RepID=A0ABW5W417_9PSEU
MAVESPGSPGAAVLLMRSGRIDEEDWTAALRAGARDRPPQEELVARGRVGSTELRVVALMAAQDAAFATVTGTVEGYTIDHGEPDVALPISDGVEPEWLLEQTTRRLSALASLRTPVSPHRERVSATTSETGGLTAIRQEILARADGRRTARDIAFLISRSVYPVTIEISRMLAEGLVEHAKPATVVAPGSLRALQPRVPKPSAPVPTPPEQLPRRERGARGPDEPPTRSGSGRHRLFGRLRARPTGEARNPAGESSSNEKGNA